MSRILFYRLACVLWAVALVGCGGHSSGSIPLTSAQAVAAAKSALVIGYATGDSALSVSQNLSLPLTGSNGSTITWVSSNSAAVTATGVVSQPGTGDAPVALTATITVGAASDIKVFPLTVKWRMTDAQAVAAAKSALAIGYAIGDSASSVSQNLTLPLTGSNGSAITWLSSNSAAATAAGVVSQPGTGDVDVTLTAMITVGAASDIKIFPLTVKWRMTDAQGVAAAKSALAIGYAIGDAATTVTQNLTLPLTSSNNCVVSWSSSTNSIVSADGSISRPVTGDVPVTLTATINSNAASDTKVFIVLVKAQMTDAQAVTAAKSALMIGYATGDSASSVTQKLTLPLTGSSGCTISWTTSDGSVDANTGTVKRPDYGDAQPTLTATISSHSVSDTTAFMITVKGQMSDADAVAAAKASLGIGYAGVDSASSVTQNMTLPLSGSDGCTVTWASDSAPVVSTAGVVTQPTSGEAIVTLTATISSHGVNDTKAFHLTVIAATDDAAAVAADKMAVAIGYGPGDSADSVTGTISLQTSGTHGSTITWSSDRADIISISGGVTTPSDSDVPVTMTATISRGGASDSAPFLLTVKALLLSSWVDSSAISPGNGAIQVDPAIVIRIPFTRALDDATVNETTFQVFRTSDSVSIPAIVNYDSSSKTVILKPITALEEGTQYSTVVAGTLKDSVETVLPRPMEFNFTTLSYADILAQWKFNGDGSDSSGKVNTLDTITGTFDSTVVHEGSASLYLNGSRQSASFNINLGTQLTVAVWVNVDNPIQPSLNTLMANVGSQEESNGFKLCINGWESSDQSVVIEVGNGTYGGKWTTEPGLILPGSWYHLAFVIDQSNRVIKIYYNGVAAPLTFVSNQSFTQEQFNYNFKTAGPFTIGAFPGGNNYNYKGHLDDMRVYNRVLSDEEISKIAQEK